MLIVEHSTKKR